MGDIKRVYGEVDVEIGPGVHAAHQTSIPDILEMARKIWNEISRSRVAADDKAGNERLLKELQKKYSDFAVSCPIPLNWMVNARKYNAHAFEKFLKTDIKLLYKDRKMFLAAQGEYLVYLFKIENPRVGVKQINDYRRAIQKNLEKDSEIFIKAQEEASTEAQRTKDEADADRRRRLYDYITAESNRGGCSALRT